MMYKIIFSPQFSTDLDNSFKYISETFDSPNAAKNLMKEIDHSITNAAENPMIYPLCPEPLAALGYRKIVVKNYIAVFYINEQNKTVNMLRLFHGRQDYLKYFN